jgi:hypothetical protein
MFIVQPGRFGQGRAKSKDYLWTRLLFGVGVWTSGATGSITSNQELGGLI